MSTDPDVQPRTPLGWTSEPGALQGAAVLRDLLEAARANGDRTFIDFEGGGSWTFSEAADVAQDAAAALADLGIGRDDRVLVALPNSADWLRAWWGASVLGAPVVPVNPMYRGEALAHIVADSRPALAIVSPDDTATLAAAGYRGPILTAWPTATGRRVPAAPLTPSDTRAIMYTSGTTGPAKGVVLAQRNGASATWFYDGRINEDDVLLADLPLFHVGGQAILVAALRVGARVAFRTSFTGQRYLDVVRATGATVTMLVGSMAAFLMQQPPRSDDADNPLRWVVCSPAPADPAALVTRFGLEDVYVGYGMTELPTLLFGSALEVPPASSGRCRPGWEVDLRDGDGSSVPLGEPGVLHVRAPDPDEVVRAYLDQPDATAAALAADGWFRTGDLFRVDADGYYFFVDRESDALRRRGENISSFEVEREVIAYPAVADAACVASPSELGDDEVKVFVVAVPGELVDPVELLRFLVDRMPPHMVPRYVEVVDDLPRSGAGRVQKAALRARGNGAGTFDRLAAG